MACTRGVITYSTLETTWPMIQPSIRGGPGILTLALSPTQYRCELITLVFVVYPIGQGSFVGAVHL